MFDVRCSLGYATSYLFVLLALLFASPAQAEVPPGWSTNLNAALKEAAASRKPVLVYFTASWCGPCKLMAQTTLQDGDVRQALGAFSRVALDIDLFPKLAEEYGVRAVPTFELLSPTGDEIVRTTGYQQPDSFVQWLTNGVAQVKEAGVREVEFNVKLVALDQLLKSTNHDSSMKAAAELFEFCAEREGGIAQSAVERLKTLAARDPSILLEGLNHPRLATRIQVANVLRARLGEAFDVDPWGETADRKKAVEQLREKMAASAGSNSPKL